MTQLFKQVPAIVGKLDFALANPARVRKFALLAAANLVCWPVLAKELGYSQQFQTCIEQTAVGDVQNSGCYQLEITRQKKRLNAVYAKLAARLSPESRAALDKAQKAWLTWRDSNYQFLSEHVPGQWVTVQLTGNEFLLQSIRSRADELEMVLKEVGLT